MNNPNNWYNNPRPMQPMQPMQPMPSGPSFAPVGCVGKFTFIELYNGQAFPMVVDSVDFATGMTTGRIPPTMGYTAIPTSSIKVSICMP